MPESPVKTFQKALASQLAVLFSGVPVEQEWAAMREENGVYSPRLDVAVGPFAFGDSVYIVDFDRQLEKYSCFCKCLYRHHVQTLIDNATPDQPLEYEHVVSRNSNARCFLAFEIENQVSRKHLMGGAINAAALGRIGIVVGWTPDKVKALVKLRSYLLFLARVGKNTFDPANLLILSKERLTDALAQILVSCGGHAASNLVMLQSGARGFGR
jgi:hypothetical protein